LALLACPLCAARGHRCADRAPGPRRPRCQFNPVRPLAQKRFDARIIHTHTFPLAEVPTAINYARERIDDAIVVQIREA
jgi:hypothetical protein